jgi:hypothetical protein
MGEMRNTYPLAGKPERKRPIGRIMCRWESSIKMSRRVWTGFIWLSGRLIRIL